MLQDNEIMEWRILVSDKTNPYLNMAIDEAIYNGITTGQSPPTIRFYDWEPATFTYGYNQILEDELDIQFLQSSKYLYVRRPTGGRLVLHEDEVTYAIISPLQGAMSGQLTETFLRISKALMIGLQKMGVFAELERGELTSAEQRQAVNPCFSSSSRFELTWKKKKIVGSAQTRNSSAFLQHGSILRTNNQKKVAQFLPNISDDQRLRIESFLDRRTISISKILDRYVTYQEAVQSLIEGFKEEWATDKFFVSKELETEELVLSRELAEKKYCLEEWNKKKTAGR